MDAEIPGTKIPGTETPGTKPANTNLAEAKLAELVRNAAERGRRLALAYPSGTRRDDFPFAVLAAFDADVRGRVERDRRIEDERDRVLIAAVNFAETLPEDEPEAVEPARRALIAAIDYLEQAVLRFGIVNRAGARLGYGEAGQRVGSRG
ncbi:hypothetical protein MKK58_15735 [Methylobacterium sp. J-078]|uniref:hypothetical protein n=1 Tax=Methylobacterium sp. J-078 TaxID=2836657 RepID=UPI001FBAFB5A|nr:hypothetical protein [Methylobacterium sp. J-078]MCJ2045974.1 hypothetical protein [Methylobacterium sp. J-078]